MKRIVITDLDNTLYDWVTYFARSFRTMVGELAIILDVTEDQILDEFRSLNRSLGTVEHPFSAFELPSVLRRLGRLPPALMKEKLESAFHAFNRERKASLRLYPGVEATLRGLHASNVIVVGHTEASLVNAYYRVLTLSIAPYLSRLYVLKGHDVKHPEPQRQADLRPPPDYVVEVPVTERKPNPVLLLDICAREGVDHSDAVYVGDSLVRDVAMARRAGVTSAWAKYGTIYSAEDWATVVRVTHWTDLDVAEDARLRAASADVRPDHTLASFGEIEAIVGLSSREPMPVANAESPY